MASYYNEIDPYAAQWLKNLIAEGLIQDGEVDTRSIVDVRPADLAGYTQCHFFAGIGGWAYALRLAGWPDDRPVWTGSCPCQPFSVAGKQAGQADARHLWPVWRELIRECCPPIIFGEQVEGTAARAWLDIVCDDLEDDGYAVGAGVLPAASIGAPQLRHRTWFVADANHAGWKGRKWTGEQRASRAEWASACGEPLRSDRGPWPPRPCEVHLIPVQPHGIPAVMGKCRAYGNAIVPQVAAAFIAAFMNAAAEREAA